MKAHPDYRAILETLKGIIKAKGYTYTRLAREIGVSEVTIKRVFSSSNRDQKRSLDRLFEICEQVGVSFLDVAALAKEEEEVEYLLTSEQETYFAGKPAHFAIFKELYQGAAPQSVARFWKLSAPRSFKILRSLEKLGLLEILSENRIRMRVRGNIRMAHRGPLARKVLRPQILDFLNHVDRVLEQDDVCMHSAEVELAEAHIPEFVAEIHALGAKYRARAFRDKSLVSPKKLKSVRWLFCFAPYRTHWQGYEP